MKPVVNTVELIPVSGGVREIDLGGPVAVDTPAHAQGGELLHLVHFRYRAMTGLALYLAGLGVLGVAKENVVGEIMDLYPFHRFCVGGIIGVCLGVEAGIGVQFLDLRGSVHLAAIFPVKFGAFGVVVDRGMTVHTHVQRRNGSVAAVKSIAMAIQTADLVDPC